MTCSCACRAHLFSDLWLTVKMQCSFVGWMTFFITELKALKCSENWVQIWLSLIMWDVGTVLCHWNHIWLKNDPISAKESEKKISLCCTGLSKWSHKNINLSGHILALVLWLLHKDWIQSDPFLPKRNKTFHPAGWGYSSGKIPAGHNKIYLLDVFEWIQSPQRGCHRSLALAA